MSDDMWVGKGLGFPAVVLPGMGQMRVLVKTSKKPRVFHVAAMRATQRSLLVISGSSIFRNLLAP
jgi:hypothetical protein